MQTTFDAEREADLYHRLVHTVFSISFLKITISIDPSVVFVLGRDSIYKAFGSVFEESTR